MEQNNEEKEYWLSDIETGHRYKVSKKYYEQYMEMWEMFKPKLDTSKCRPILYGTGGDMESSSKDWAEWLYKTNTDGTENQ